VAEELTLSWAELSKIVNNEHYLVMKKMALRGYSISGNSLKTKPNVRINE